MPTWFIILAKVLSMLAYLIPQVEQQFGDQAGAGPAKKEAVLGRVRDWLDTPQAASAHPALDDNTKASILAFAGMAVDNIVDAANACDAFPPPEVKTPDEPEPATAPTPDSTPPWMPTGRESSRERSRR